MAYRTSSTLITFLLLLVSLICSPVLAESESSRVLVLHSHHSGHRWSEGVSAGIREKLTRRKGFELFVEHISADQFRSSDFMAVKRKFLLQKYEGQSFDFILPVDRQALSFALANRESIFPETPVVFCGLDQFDDIELEGVDGITGVYETIDIRRNIDQIIANRQRIKSIVVLNDDSPQGIKLSQEFLDLSDYYEEINWYFPRVRSRRQLEKLVGFLTHDDAVILGVFNRDMDGSTIGYEELATLVTTTANAPVYGLWDTHFGLGILGGYLAMARQQGEQAAELILQIRSGAPIDSIEPIRSLQNRYHQDHQVASHYSIPQPTVEDALIINAPTSFYQENKRLTLAIAGTVFSLGAVTLMLSFLLYKKRKAENDLRKLTTELEDRVNLRTANLLKAYEELTERDEEMQRLLSNLPGVVYRCLNDEHWTMLFLSEGIEKLTGYSATDLYQNKVCSYASLIHGADRQGLDKAVEKSIEDRSHFIVEYRLNTKDGEQKWIWEEGLAVFDSEGQVSYLDGFITDITVRKEAELEQAKLVTAIKQTDELIVITGKNGLIEYVNPAFTEITGYEAEEAMGKNPRILKSGEQDLAYYQELWRTIMDGEVWRGRFVNRKKNGQRYLAEAVISPVRNRKGEITNFVAVQRDITSQVNMEKNLRQAQKLEAMGTLAGGIAHEINTPAQFVGNNLNFLTESFEDLQAFVAECVTMLESKSVDVNSLQESFDKNDVEFLLDEIPDALKQTVEGVEQISNIVSSMKQFAHPGEEEKVATNINESLQNTVTVCRNEWKYSAEMEFNLDPDLPLVPCHRSEMNQVFLNIVVNAAHAIEPTLTDERKLGTIQIGTSSVDGFIQIRIGDDGAGIPEEIRDRLYDPFFTTKEPGKGTGQGLSIAHTIITEKHGGKLSLESEVGKGTVFTISLPIESTTGATGS